MQRLPVRFRKHRHRFNPHFPARADDPHRDLSPVGNQYFSCHSLSLPYHKCKLRAGNHLAVHRRHRVSNTVWASLFDDLRLQSQLIPGTYHPLEPTFLNASEKRDLAFMLRHAQDCHRTHLSQRFHDQHARHNRLSRKMPREKILPVCDTFITDGVLPRLVIFNLIHQQKRMPVRDDLHDLLCIQTVHILPLPFSCSCIFLRDRCIPT